MYSAVVFDCDGTLINTLPDIISAVNSVFRRHLLPEQSEEHVRSAVGFGVEQLLRNLGVPERLNFDLAREVSEKYTGAGESGAMLYEGVMEMITTLQDNGISMFVLSNKPQEGLEKSLLDFFPGGQFVSVKGSLPGKPVKPSPDILLGMLREHDIPPGKALLVGDGEADVLVAKNAGVDSVSVLWGFRTKEALEKSGAERFAQTPDDVTDFVLRGN